LAQVLAKGAIHNAQLVVKVPRKQIVLRVGTLPLYRATSHAAFPNAQSPTTLKSLAAVPGSAKPAISRAWAVKVKAQPSVQLVKAYNVLMQASVLINAHLVKLLLKMALAKRVMLSAAVAMNLKMHRAACGVAIESINARVCVNVALKRLIFWLAGDA
jgi:hypothetical protein